MRSARQVILALLAWSLVSAGAVSAHVGTGIDVDREGRIYFTDTLRNCIWRIGADAHLTLLARDLHINYLILGADSQLYVVEGDVWRITPEGKAAELLRFSNEQEGAGYPLAMNRSGNLFLMREKKIFVRTSEGKTSLLAPREGQVQEAAGNLFAHVNAAAVGADGLLYVRDGHVLRRITLDGSASTLTESAEASGAPAGEENLRRTMGLAADDQGNVYVANYWKRRVLKVAPGGQVTTVLRSPWPWVPTGVTVAEGEVYVLERLGNPYGPTAYLALLFPPDWLGHPRVRKVSPHGRASTVAVVGGRLTVLVIGAILFLFLLSFLVRRTVRSRAAR